MWLYNPSIDNSSFPSGFEFLKVPELLHYLVQAPQSLQKQHVVGTSPQTGNGSLMESHSVSVCSKFLLGYRCPQSYLSERFDMNSSLSFFETVLNTRNLKDENKFLVANQGLKFLFTILVSNLQKTKCNESHQEHFNSGYFRPFRCKLAVEVEKQFSSVLLNLSFRTDVHSRALFSQEYSGISWLSLRGNEAPSCLPSLTKLPV